MQLLRLLPHWFKATLLPRASFKASKLLATSRVSSCIVTICVFSLLLLWFNAWMFHNTFILILQRASNLTFRASSCLNPALKLQLISLSLSPTSFLYVSILSSAFPNSSLDISHPLSFTFCSPSLLSTPLPLSFSSFLNPLFLFHCLPLYFFFQSPFSFPFFHSAELSQSFDFYTGSRNVILNHPVLRKMKITLTFSSKPIISPIRFSITNPLSHSLLYPSKQLRTSLVRKGRGWSQLPRAQ